jgi:biotin carboxylase
MRKILLLGAGSDVYRRYLLESITREYEVVLARASSTPWADDLVQASHAVAPDDVEPLVQLAAREHVDGVLTWMESCVEAAAAVSAALGLPGHPPGAARASRDKHLMRTRWAQRGVASAASRLVTDLDSARRAAYAIGFPVVVKPRALAGSVGVVLARDEEELERAFDVAGGAELDRYETVVKGVLVEEYLDGPEVSVESIVHAGRVHAVAVTQKRTGLPPGFEELGHVVGASPLLCDETLRRLLVDAHAALGLRDGATHAEVRLTAQGPRLVEIAARLAGDLIPKLVRHATGVDLGLAAAAVATGAAPDVRSTAARHAQIAFVYPERSGEVLALSAAPVVHAPDEARWVVAPGARVGVPPEGFIGRLGYVLCVDDAPDACASRTRTAADAMVAELAGLAAPGACEVAA